MYAKALAEPARAAEDTGVIDRLDWPAIATHLDGEGYALLPGLLGAERVHDLAGRIDDMNAYRVSLAATGLGSGELFYFDHTPWAEWRAAFYRHLAIIANRWNETLGIADRYRPELPDSYEADRSVGQAQRQSYVCRLGTEDYLSLHQHANGERIFPLQIVALLSEPEKDFEGGQFVMVERRPRMQSRPIVLPLRLGDAAIICAADRPFRGNSGYYRVNLKHAISRVHRGERIGAEWSFHDAW